jgi:hypothetical protein
MGNSLLRLWSMSVSLCFKRADILITYIQPLVYLFSSPRGDELWVQRAIVMVVLEPVRILHFRLAMPCELHTCNFCPRCTNWYQRIYTPFPECYYDGYVYLDGICFSKGNPPSILMARTGDRITDSLYFVIVQPASVSKCIHGPIRLYFMY